MAVDAERALAEAAAVDEVTAKGGDPGALAGIPLAVKDNHDAVGYRSTFGAPVLADAPMAPVDSPFVARLRGAGCVVVGKTNLPEFAWTGNTTNALFGATANPFNPAHGAGGSSGGAAAALAAGMVPLATGSDGGGSIRIPSAVLRPLGHEALARAGARRRPQPARLARPLHQRSHGPPHRRRRDRPRCGRRPRPVRPALPAPP